MYIQTLIFSLGVCGLLSRDRIPYLLKQRIEEFLLFFFPKKHVWNAGL